MSREKYIRTQKQHIHNINNQGKLMFKYWLSEEGIPSWRVLYLNFTYCCIVVCFPVQLSKEIKKKKLLLKGNKKI